MAVAKPDLVFKIIDLKNPGDDLIYFEKAIEHYSNVCKCNEVTSSIKNVGNLYKNRSGKIVLTFQARYLKQ